MDHYSDPEDYDVESIGSAFDEDAIQPREPSDKPSDAKDAKEKDVKDGQAEPFVVGMVCHVKNLWEGKRKCACCVNWVEERPEDIQPNPEETQAVQQYALLVRNTKSHGRNGKTMMLSSIVVQSPLLKPLLEDVFEGYAGITATLKKVTFSAPFAPFFYRWDRFKKAVADVEDETARAHAQLLYDLLVKELDETITTYHDLLSHQVVTFKYLWTLFKPGDLLLGQVKGEDTIMKLQTADMGHGGFHLNAKYVDYNGSSFGYATHHFSIHPYEGTKAIVDLPIYPIQFNNEASEIEKRLTARGKKFVHLQGYHYKMYKGFAELMPSTFGRRQIATRNRAVDGRIIIHADMYNRYNPTDFMHLEPLESTSFAPRLPSEMEPMHHNGHHGRRYRNVSHMPPPPSDPLPPPPPPPPLPQHGMPNMQMFDPYAAQVLDLHGPAHAQKEEEPKALSDELYKLCAPTIKGYSLKSKNWARFMIDNVQDIVWDDRAFDNLVLPSGYKDLILSFTRNQKPNEGIIDDVIEGKGQGIVMLLSGEPGVGKTLTAESVAEHMRVPLYSMSAAQLGIDSAEVEQTLADILEMTTKWGAILLLDETEVFLEQRTIDGLERNKLVSIFLRMLEYYRGVLFLTTNRVAMLDKALESRIHLKIAYPELDRESRLRVWRNLIDMLPPASVGLEEADLEQLARKKLNGREIKNVIKAAQLLANGQTKALGVDHIDTVLKITQIGADFRAQA